MIKKKKKEVSEEVYRQIQNIHIQLQTHILTSFRENDKKQKKRKKDKHSE